MSGLHIVSWPYSTAWSESGSPAVPSTACEPSGEISSSIDRSPNAATSASISLSVGSVSPRDNRPRLVWGTPDCSLSIRRLRCPGSRRHLRRSVNALVAARRRRAEVGAIWIALRRRDLGDVSNKLICSLCSTVRSAPLTARKPRLQLTQTPNHRTYVRYSWH